MKTILNSVLFLWFIGFSNNLNAQNTRYIILLKDKGSNPFTFSNPIQYLTQRAIDRRTRYNIPLDSTDLPITPRYIDSIRLAGAVTILNSSKWLNQVAIKTSDAAALAKINSFPFVMNTAPIGARNATGKPVNKQIDGPDDAPVPTGNQLIAADYFNYGSSYGQVHLHNGEFLHNRGFRGQGMQLAVLDGGFYRYLTLPTFDSARNNNQILGTWDFVDGNASVNEDHPHGMQCLSTIAANMPGTFVGTAPKASFYLYRTEDVNTEYPIEEQNWAAGIERADSLGIDVSSTSLGYYSFDNPVFDHVYADMDGNTTLIARAADLAAKKGIIVVVAAGNEGNGSWHYIITPADGDSVIAVGAVNSSGVVGSFSSYGPSSDGQIKPDLAAVGVGAIIANTNTGNPSSGNGTSFACPNLAGLTTCLWQAFPEVNNMAILSVMQQNATRSNNPDNRVGYGIPDMKKAFVRLIKQLYIQSSSVASCRANLQWTAKTDSVINIVLERKTSATGAYATVNTFNSTGAFAARNFSYSDDLSVLSSSPITYRFKMNIASDTSFYLDSIVVNFSPKPNLGADKSAAICAGKTYNLTTQFTTTGLNNTWTFGGNTVSNPASVSVAGNYQLISVNNSGCADTAVLVLAVNPQPNLGPDKAINKCTDSIINLTAQFNTTGLASSWTLNGTAVSNPSFVTAAGIYQLIATSSNCSDTALFTITNDPQICIASLTEKILISPNPVRDNLNVLVVRKNAVKTGIVIQNTVGQTVYSKIIQQAAGAQTYTIPMKLMAKGLYFVSVSINDQNVVTKKIARQ